MPPMSVQPTIPDKQDQAYPPFQLYQPVGRNTRCRHAVPPKAIPGLAECAKRLNNGNRHPFSTSKSPPNYNTKFESYTPRTSTQSHVHGQDARNNEIETESAQESLKRCKKTSTGSFYSYRCHVVVTSLNHKQPCLVYTKEHIDAIGTASDIAAPRPVCLHGGSAAERSY